MTDIHQTFLDFMPTLERSLAEPLSIGGLVGPFRIFQRRGGHRHSIDDATIAWYALQKGIHASPPTKTALDLGTGIGTVGLAVLWGLGEGAHLTCIEAQAISFELLQANIQCNGLANQVTAIHGDIRELNLAQKFPLITGSPPYFPAHAGVLPADSQKAHARFELRGDVGDYARAAKRHLEEGGTFVFCFPFQQRSRAIGLVEAVGFKIATVRNVVPRVTKPPLFSLFSARLNFDGPTISEPDLIVAGEDNKYTAEMLELQATRGFGPEGTNRLE